MRTRLFRFGELKALYAVRYSLATLIPVLMLGAFSLVLRSLPVAFYQQFIAQWQGGALYSLFDAVYNATFGMLSLYTACMVGYHYGSISDDFTQSTKYGTVIVSIAVFLLLSGVTTKSIEPLGTKGMLLALISAILGSTMFMGIVKKMRPTFLFADGADIITSGAIKIILPVSITVMTFAVCSKLFIIVTGGENLYEFIISKATLMLTIPRYDLVRGIMFVVISSVLWFFGIHGSDIFEGAVAEVFSVATETNIALVAAGNAPTEILTKPFFDLMVLIGGCGASMGLLLSILLFSRRRSTRQLSKAALLPMVFNVNEIMVFGLPIIYNHIFLIPFLLTPLVCFSTTYFAMFTGLVPMVIREVEWTTPIFFSGYLATGSVAGAVIQGINLALSVLIYYPFVKLYDREKDRTTNRDYQQLVQQMKDSELNRTNTRITELPGSAGGLAKALASEITHARDSGQIAIYYQPQYQLDGRCIGGEALLRWNHPQLGSIYPPLALRLAEETHQLADLEEWIVRTVAADSCLLHEKMDGDYTISVNVTGITMQTKRFESFLMELAGNSDITAGSLCIELTEQAVLQLNDDIRKRFTRFREAGFHLAVDDFSMGSTSLQYLLGGQFDSVKLDGSLVKEISDNPRCREIITSIMQLSKTLGFSVLAEYVETEKLRDELAGVGCTRYQGWYYAKAQPFADFAGLITSSKIIE